MNTGKNHSFDYTDFCGKVMSLLFNLLSRFTIAFLHGASLELALTIWTFMGKMMSLLFNLLSRFTVAFLHGASLELALTIGTFMGKVMSLLFNTLSRFVIAFLPRAKSLLIYKQLSPCLGKAGGFIQQFPHSTRSLATCAFFFSFLCLSFFLSLCLLHGFHVWVSCSDAINTKCLL